MRLTETQAFARGSLLAPKVRTEISLMSPLERRRILNYLFMDYCLPCMGPISRLGCQCGRQLGPKHLEDL